jgi:STAS-like domain of unknown function (DUF4325)
MQDSIITIRIMDVVSGTATNAGGIALFANIDKILSTNQKVRLSLDDCTPFSTSFLNSSIGNLIDKYGIDKFKSLIVYSQIKPSQIKKLKSYLEQVSC